MQLSETGLQSHQRWGLIVGVSAFVFLLLLPLNLPPLQHRLLALLALTFTFWVTEALPLPVTALLAMLLCAVLNIVPAKQAFAPLGNPIIFSVPRCLFARRSSKNPPIGSTMGGVAFVKAMGCADTFQNIDGFWGCGLGNFWLDEQHSDNGDPLPIGVANISRVKSKIEATRKFGVNIDACLRLCIFSRRNCHTSWNTSKFDWLEISCRAGKCSRRLPAMDDGSSTGQYCNACLLNAHSKVTNESRYEKR